MNMKETDTGLISENDAEASIMSGSEFMNNLLYKLRLQRFSIVNLQNSDGQYMFESVDPAERQKVKNLIKDKLESQKKQ